MSETVRCSFEPDCLGAAVYEDRCLAHAPAERLGELMQADRVDGRGGRYDTDRVRALLEAIPIERSRHQLSSELIFDDAVFTGPLEWSRFELGGRVSFRRARFEDRVDLGPDGTFKGPVDFEGAVFLGETEIVECAFMGGASLTDTVFERSARLSSFFDGMLAERAVFKQYTTLQFLLGKSHVTWDTSRFEAPVFLGASVDGWLRFTGSTFADSVQFSTSKATNLDFKGSRFVRGGDLGTLVADQVASFQDVTFENPVRLRVQASKLDLRRALVLRGGELMVEARLLAIAGASFQRPTTLAAARFGASERVTGVDYGMPRLGRLAGADVGELSIDGFDLRGCRLAGAHNLDEMRLGDKIVLPRSPKRGPGRARRTIYDEHEVRTAKNSWKLDAAPAEPASLEVNSDSSERPASPTAVAVAASYRALRKAREDAKDAAGASDFYYGEMEMRRRDEGGPLLSAYWLVSGYGTRALRALTSYVCVIVGIAALMQWFGFEKPHPSLARAFTFTLTSTVFVGHTPGGGLTPGGDLLQLGLRLLGPLLLGLALLALRTRVQR